MADLNCPECDSKRTRYSPKDGWWECLDCGRLWGYDKTQTTDDYPENCPECWGTGKIYLYVNDAHPSKCSLCDGTGSI
ncbi:MULTISPECIES: hypothetical protein [unclassified Nostoc]|uniref:hypothetical protein n=1 Tax=unclassified Nostoc TaxID=2593658 RepID=UPI0011808339|nr:hypothetical protein [Nostoc sp. 'Peltigera membranacea cyanobiont' 232]